MAIIKDSVLIPLNRQLFIPKEGNMTMDNIIIETDGEYRLFEKDNYIIVKNDDCCRSIKVTIRTKD
jgi:hypothetical protein